MNNRTTIFNYENNVVEIAGRAANMMIGVVVDSDSEVLSNKAEVIEETRTFGMKLNTDYIIRMANIGKSIKILLDIDRVLGADDITQLEQRTLK
jgi:purine-binding chemotaxis protein CheW